ncbi:putative alpha/beta-hydrolase family hydrolase [Nakamurella sp. UYEF19]|uniref:alpha/beta hydrolase family protein n=1 Tax=Nakamurella sp. UYEF19 TaxID=1756392 RepID=UPI00339B2625
MDNYPHVGGLLLTPGAGGTRDHRTLLAVQQDVAPLPCLRLDFPARIAGRRAPDRAPVAVAHLVQNAACFAAEVGFTPDRLVLGGRSYGGRMSSIAVAQGLPAAGLVLLSYPLHPPGRPDKLRVEHFPDIEIPVLVISGDKDPFGTPAEFDEHLTAIRGQVTVVRLSGGHDPAGGDQLIGTAVRDWLAQL